VQIPAIKGNRQTQLEIAHVHTQARLTLFKGAQQRLLAISGTRRTSIQQRLMQEM
jgi:hypothetical protein